MKLLFKQRFFSWLDSYDIFDEAGNTVYTVKGQLAWGHCLKIFDANGYEVSCGDVLEVYTTPKKLTILTVYIKDSTGVLPINFFVKTNNRKIIEHYNNLSNLYGENVIFRDFLLNLISRKNGNKNTQNR